MYYIYELSCEGIVFYIGKTIRPLKRYKEHASAIDLSTNRITYWILLHNKKLDFRILFCTGNYTDAFFCESKTIMKYRDIKHKLCNIDYNTGNTLDLPIVGCYNKPAINKQYIKEVKQYIDNFNKSIQL